jgi:carotenoid cleavage dioxygenase-like enzyme
VVRLLPLNFSKPCMTHDFAITPNYAIFFEVTLEKEPNIAII